MVFKSLLRATVFASSLMMAGGVFVSPALSEVVYNRGNSADPESLDPHKTSTVYEAHILRDLFDGLVHAGRRTPKLIPGAAESWTISDDGLVYTFKLRADAVWSDGTPVTADDFVYAFRRLEDPATGAEYASMLYRREERRGGEHRQGEAGGTRREGRRSDDVRGDAEGADALFPRNADAPGDLSGQQGVDRQARRRLDQARQSGFERRLHAGRVRAQRPHQAGQESEVLRCGEREDRCRQLFPDRGPLDGDQALRGWRARLQ